MHSSSSIAPPPRLSRKILVHHRKNACRCSVCSASFHHLVNVLARFEKRGRVALAAEKTPRSRRSLQPIGQPTLGMIVAHVAPICCGSFSPSPSGRIRRRSADGRTGASRVLAQVAPHQLHALALDDENRRSIIRFSSGIAARGRPHDRRMRRELAHDAAHLPHLAHIHHDRRDADHGRSCPSSAPARTPRASENRAPSTRGDVLLDEHDAHERWNMRSE